MERLNVTDGGHISEEEEEEKEDAISKLFVYSASGVLILSLHVYGIRQSACSALCTIPCVQVS